MHMALPFSSLTSLIATALRGPRFSSNALSKDGKFLSDACLLDVRVKSGLLLIADEKSRFPSSPLPGQMPLKSL
jgi:hypothetical protein